LQTRVFLIRHGVTSWHDEGKVLGQRDVPLSAAGIAQAEATAAALDGIAISDVITSPLQRAIQSAEIIGQRFGIEVARDPRLTDFGLGHWTGQSYQDLEQNPEYQAFLADPLAERIPGGESLADVRDRVVDAIEQALQDSPTGDALAMVTHAGVIRVLLSHYLGSHLGNYHRIRVSPGSISVLSFASATELPRVLAINHCSALSEVL